MAYWLNLIAEYNMLKNVIWFVTNVGSKWFIIQSLWPRILSWYRKFLLHSGQIQIDYKEYHDMAWSYTRYWILIIRVHIVKYVIWQRRSTRNMACSRLKQQILAYNSWVMICVDLDLVGPFNLLTPSKSHSLLAIKVIDPVIYHRLVWN
jgi:hypothetical protein